MRKKKVRYGQAGLGRPAGLTTNKPVGTALELSYSDIHGALRLLYFLQRAKQENPVNKFCTHRA